MNFFPGADALHSPGTERKLPPDADDGSSGTLSQTLGRIHKNPFMSCSLIHTPQASNLQQIHGDSVGFFPNSRLFFMFYFNISSGHMHVCKMCEK